ncbi:penicillin-binding protein activator [Dokdonella sp.]|uniref:penicillin-binding protein activator n=1 Tax=Dokdonella sp. TaxID=2291710 RepID=UPI001B057036|nr:penicillin-binding protein activator [Dokdonella sp.]MBO9665077.1 penicillin-binding protein activator [Dokdonella sp.]
MTLRLPGTSTFARGAATGLLVLLLSACATMSDFGPSASPEVSSPDADRAEQFYEQGDFERAAGAFLDLARTHRGDSAAHYQLRAAEALRELGDLDGAARALDDVKRRRLHGDEPLRLDLLDAEIALKRGDAPRALALLTIDQDAPPNLRLRALELRARADVAGGDAFASAQTRAQLDRLLGGADREQNRKQLQDTLATLDANALKSRFDQLAPNDPLRPWIEQALRKQGHALARELPRPSQPVGTMRPGQDGALEAEGYQPAKRVALLLPLNAQLAGVANAIRDGFLAAYFTDAPERRPELRIYDAGKTPEEAVAAYTKAVGDGADRVVGPLQRESVGALFHQPLTAHVLALNHPDTGEVPPPGSAEYGLLPEAEGAQVAERLRERGIRNAAILIAEADWAERAARAFRAQFEAGGGAITGESRLREKEINYATSITQATASLGADGAVFISMRPQQARLLVPQMKIANVTAPVFATSHIYAGDSNATLDRDLDGVEFCDAPWLFGPLPGRPERSVISGQIASANGVGARLFAFGMDAYALLPYVDWLIAHPDAYLGGATGELTADNFGRVHRLVSWARFVNGMPQPAEGALNTAPMQFQ